MGEAIAVIGAQWGDEGKGKLVDVLAQNSKCCARFNGGANAGHTLVVNGVKSAFHLLPCGVLNANVVNLIGQGMVVHLQTLAQELDHLAQVSKASNVDQRIRISSRCHLTFDFHRAADAADEDRKADQALGTTRRGIGPSYAAKALRVSLRGSDLRVSAEVFRERYLSQYHFFRSAFHLEAFDFEAELAVLEPLRARFAPLVIDATIFLHDLLNEAEDQENNHPTSLNTKWSLVIEGANATMLDINLGSYPFCTSSLTTVAGIAPGLGIPPKMVSWVVGVAKAYCTRVGEGPFPSELHDEVGKTIQRLGAEFGTSTGRPRRAGWFDAQMVRYSQSVNGFDSLMITKLDVLSTLDELKIVASYRDANGVQLPSAYFPADIDELKTLTFDEIVLPGWKQPIDNVKEFEELPSQAQQYIQAIETLVEIPIDYIGIGPDRTSILCRRPGIRRA